MSVFFGSIFALQTLSIGCHKSLSQCWHTVSQISDTHLLCVCVCIVCPGGAAFGTGHLIGSWSLAVQGYMLDWLGYVTSTVSSCQLSGCVCYPMNLYAYLHTLYGPIGPMTVCSYCICIIFE